MALIVISSERFAEHQTPPGHPECPERADVMDVIASEWRRQGGEVVAPPLATTSSSPVCTRLPISSALPEAPAAPACSMRIRIPRLKPTKSRGSRRERRSMPLNGSWAAAPAGDRACASARPSRRAGPSHGILHLQQHRRRGRACRTLGADRVAIVDYDVHHGNGTQHMFESRRDVLFISTHQFPYYPGTGAVDEIGRGREKDSPSTCLSWSGRRRGLSARVSDVIAPALRQFKPDLLLVSAGFDAHERDPLGGMRLTAGGFAAMTMELRRVAEECCEGRMALVTEGGYDFLRLTESLRAVVSVLSLDRAAAPDWPTSDCVAPSRGRTAVAAAKEAFGTTGSCPDQLASAVAVNVPKPARAGRPKLSITRGRFARPSGCATSSSDLCPVELERDDRIQAAAARQEVAAGVDGRPRLRGRGGSRRARSSTAWRCSPTPPGMRTSATFGTTSSAT